MAASKTKKTEKATRPNDASVERSKRAAEKLAPGSKDDPRKASVAGKRERDVKR